MSNDQEKPLYSNNWESLAHVWSADHDECNCCTDQKDMEPFERRIHLERQDTECDAWKRLLDLIDQASSEEWEVFSPGEHLAPEDWMKIIELPKSISKLESVRFLELYGSNLRRIPPEIGFMYSLEEFNPYTSYCLHWFPYEITQCYNLRESCISTRALYGNPKNHAPFPKLPCLDPRIIPDFCSACYQFFDEPFTDPHLQFWISQVVGTDVVPLLAHVCSMECASKLGEAAPGYIDHPHQGGLDLA